MQLDKVVYLIGGPNGSGKTTLAHELLRDYPNLKFMNADEISAQYHVSIIEAARIVINNVVNTLNSGESFVLETTLSGTYQNELIKNAHEKDYRVVFSYVMLASPEQNIARVKQRVQLGGHNVPEDVLRRRYIKSIKNFIPVCEMSDSWILYYNGDKQITEIAHNTDKCVVIKDKDKYNETLREIAKLADRGAQNAQKIAQRAGIDVMYERFR